MGRGGGGGCRRKDVWGWVCEESMKVRVGSFDMESGQFKYISRAI